MSKVVDPDDADATRLRDAARKLKARGVTKQVVLGYIDEIYKPKPPKPPAKGLWLPMVLKQPVHDTAGLPDFPANDLFAKPGTLVIVTQRCELVWPHKIPWSKTKRVGGQTCYLLYSSLPGRKKTGFVTHMGVVAKAGFYEPGEVIGNVAEVPNGWWDEHVHYGLHTGIYDPRL